jgi:hypothetical protein
MTSSVNQRLKRKRRSAREAEYREELERLRVLGKAILQQGLKDEIAAEDAGKTSEAPMCESCGVNPADPPGRLCVGCEAYKEHQQ